VESIPGQHWHCFCSGETAGRSSSVLLPRKSTVAASRSPLDSLQRHAAWGPNASEFSHHMHRDVVWVLRKHVIDLRRYAAPRAGIGQRTTHTRATHVLAVQWQNHDELRELCSCISWRSRTTVVEPRAPTLARGKEERKNAKAKIARGSCLIRGYRSGFHCSRASDSLVVHA
jgi:hypothetical protein